MARLTLHFLGLYLLTNMAIAADAINLSSRAFVGTGQQKLNTSVVVTGTGRKDFLFRAKGPSMADQGISGTLQDPYLKVVDLGSMEVIAEVDDWQDSPYADRLVAEGLAPSHSKEAAAILSLTAGAYSMQVTGVGDGTGIGQASIKELGLIGDSSFDNLAGLWVVDGYPSSLVSINRGIYNDASYVSTLIGYFGPDRESDYMEGYLNNNMADIGSQIDDVVTTARITFTSSGNAILRFSACSCIYPLHTDLHMVKIW